MSAETPQTVVATLDEVVFADGSSAAVDLVAAAEPAPDGEVFAALVLLQDAEGRFALVYSPRRAEWASPGGFREPGETVTETVVREVLEETGLTVSAAALVPCGFERFRPLSPAGRWPQGGGALQVYRAQLTARQPAMRAQGADVTDHRWVSLPELQALCGTAFWWPLVEVVLSRRAGPAPGRG